MVFSIASGVSADGSAVGTEAMGIVRIARADLVGLDALTVDSLVLPMFEVCAQPRSVAGYVDWRLCGRLAKLLKSGRFSGQAQEALLTSPLGRLPTDRIFLLGLGRPRPPQELSSVLREQVGTLYDAGARVLAVAPPSPVITDSPAPMFLVRWLEAVASTGVRFEEVILLDPGNELLMSQDSLQSASNKAGMTWGAESSTNFKT